MRQSPLETEVAVYERKRDEFLSTAEGKFVLVKGEAVVGFYDTLDEAMVQGYEQFGLEPFLARRVAKEDEAINFTSLLVTP